MRQTTDLSMIVPDAANSDGYNSTPYIRDYVTSDNLRREAVVYMRVSTDKQVANNQESLRYQMNLTGRAAQLGWATDRIRVITDDLGVSAVYGTRKGFLDLLADTAEGRIGIIFVFDSSRAVRKAGDMYLLVDAAIHSGTLIADHNRIYDPRDFNDRMMLYLSGLFSEAECHNFHLRGAEARRGQVLRGVYRQRLPTGLVRLPDGEVIKIPDQSVQEALNLVFQKFEELGSCGRVLRQLVREQVKLPGFRNNGADKGRLVWSRPSRYAILGIIRNPAYTGTFVYGRTKTVRHRGRDGCSRVRKPMSEWVVIQGIYPAYITWEQYTANLTRLGELAAEFKEQVEKSQGDAREGAALLTGLARCGVCGHKMTVTYNHVGRYICCAQLHQYGTFSCASIHTPSVDAVVIDAFFEALRPSHLDALEAVLSKQNEEIGRIRGQWERRIERTRYETRRAEQQHDAVDPDNRLVAAELERCWEEKLVELKTLEAEYERLLRRPQPVEALSPEIRRQFQTISESLPGLWHNDHIPNSQRKELLRSLISSVVLKRVAADRVEVRIVWVSGQSAVVYGHSPAHRNTDLPSYEALLERIKTLWSERHSDRMIAARLTAEGFHGARSKVLLANTVLEIRRRRGWIAPPQKRRGDLAVEGYLTATALASCLGVGLDWVCRRLRDGRIDSKYLAPRVHQHVWLIRNDVELIKGLRLEAAQGRRRGCMGKEH